MGLTLYKFVTSSKCLNESMFYEFKNNIIFTATGIALLATTQPSHFQNSNNAIWP